MIPKYGLEGTLYLRDAKTEFTYDSEAPSQTCQGVSLKLFQRVVVRILLDDSNVQHEKLVLKLVTPSVPGFSVDPIKTPTKRPASAETEAMDVDCKPAAKKNRI